MTKVGDPFSSIFGKWWDRNVTLMSQVVKRDKGH